MKFVEFDIIFENEIPDKDIYEVVVVFVNGERHIFRNIKKEHLNHPNFEKAIRKQVRRDISNDDIEGIFVVGDGGEEYPIQAINPAPKDDGEIPAPGPDVTTDVPGEITPTDNNDNAPEAPKTTDDNRPSQTEPTNVEPPEEGDASPEVPDDTIPKPEVSTDGSDDIKPSDSDVAPEVSQKDDQKVETPPPPSMTPPDEIETGIPVEVLPPEQQDLVPQVTDSPEPLEVEIISQEEFEEIMKLSQEGGDGAEGEGGEAGGETGGGELTPGEIESIPDISAALYEALNGGIFGFFTDEETIFTELDKITRRKHFDAVAKQYENIAGEKLTDRLVLHFQQEGKKGAEDVKRLNDILKTFDIKLQGTTGDGLEGKLEIADVEDDDTSSEDSSYTPSREEREQMSEANYLFDAIWSQLSGKEDYTNLENVQFTDADGKFRDVDPAEYFGLDEPAGSVFPSAADALYIRQSIADKLPLIDAGSPPQENTERSNGPLRTQIDLGVFGYKGNKDK
jgi:hypothetical protein